MFAMLPIDLSKVPALGHYRCCKAKASHAVDIMIGAILFQASNSTMSIHTLHFKDPGDCHVSVWGE